MFLVQRIRKAKKPAGDLSSNQAGARSVLSDEFFLSTGLVKKTGQSLFFNERSGITNPVERRDKARHLIREFNLLLEKHGNQTFGHLFEQCYREPV